MGGPPPANGNLKQPVRAFGLHMEVTAHVDDAVHRTPLYTKFEVRRPSRTEYIVDFRKRPGDLDL